MNGLLIIDKPAGMTSHDVVRRLRRLCRTRRVGHAGTLDPLATGVLLVAVGEGTRVLQFLVEGTKVYRATLRFGAATTTQDAEGEITEECPWERLQADGVREACRQMTGEQQQLPPMYSAIKVQGVALHRLARKGIEVEREPRTVQIDRLTVERLALPELTFEVVCSKGTYVRTLCHDIGRRLGTAAHLTALRRIASGSFSVDEAVSLDGLEQAGSEAVAASLLPLREALRDYPACAVTEEGAAGLSHGIPPRTEQLTDPIRFAEGDRVILTRAQKVLAMARFAPAREREKRGDFELLRVFSSSE